MAKVSETAEAIASTSGNSSKVQQELLAEPPVILNGLSEPSEAQNTIKECENCALLKAKNRKLRNQVRMWQESLAKQVRKQKASQKRSIQFEIETYNI